MHEIVDPDSDNFLHRFLSVVASFNVFLSVKMLSHTQELYALKTWTMVVVLKSLVPIQAKVSIAFWSLRPVSFIPSGKPVALIVW